MHKIISKQEAFELLNSDVFEILDYVKDINNSRNTKYVTFSKNIFLPLTHVCQNNCGYCNFKQLPENLSKLIMDENEVIDLFKKANKFNCTEALFTFGENADSNELILDKLNEFGFTSMVDYVYYLSKIALNQYDILPHTNMGIISKKQLNKLSVVNASMGLMLETTNKKLLNTVVHRDSPGKNPKKRIEFIKNAGKEKIPFTTGLLIGIGETTEDHVESLFTINKLHQKYGHIQEIIIQNFKPKINTPMENYSEPSIIDLIKLTILSSLMFEDVSIQIPPNLNTNLISLFTLMGADDFGGISPITKDFVNSELPWPKINDISRQLESINYTLKERLPVYNKFISKEYLSTEVYNKTLEIKKRNNID